MTSRRTFLAGAVGSALLGAGAARSLPSAQQPDGPPPSAGDRAALGLAGDGRADDGVALQRLLDRHAAAGGGEVALPPGVYRLTESLTVPPEVTLAFAQGARLTGDAQVQVDGAIAAGLQHVFDGVRVRFAPGRMQWALPQWWGARGDGEHDDSDALQQALNARIVMLFAGQYRTTRELVVRNRSTIMGVGNSWSPTPTTDSWIQYDGPADPEIAVLRVATAPVGQEPEHAVTNVHLEKVVLNGGNRAGYGLYSVFCTNDSSFVDVTARHCTQHGIFIARQWYASYRGLVARDNAGCGITIGYRFDGWSDRGVNGIELQNLRASGNGGDGRFHERTNRAWGYGVYFRPGAGTTLRHVVAEKNHGAGLVYDLGPRSSTAVENVYLEGNGVDGRGGGATRAWGLIVIGHRNARANSINRVYLHGVVGDDDAQSVWLTGEPPASNLVIRDISLGHYLHADWGRYVLSGYAFTGLTGHIVGEQPASREA